MQITSCRLSCNPFVVLLGCFWPFRGSLGALFGLSWGSPGALSGLSGGLLGHASDPLGLMSSSWPLLAAFLGQPLPVLNPILVTFLIIFWVLFWIVF